VSLRRRMRLVAVAAPRRPDEMHAAHLARPERGEPSAVDNGGFERKLRREQPIDLARRRRLPGLVVVEDDAAILAKVDAVGANAEAEAPFHPAAQVPARF